MCVTGYTQDVNALRIVEVPKPVPKPHQVLVKVRAAALNSADLYVIAGLMEKARWKVSFPYTPGYEFAGVVEEVGKDVSSLHVGDEVFGLNWGSASHDSKDGDAVGSCLAEHVAISAKKVCLKPPALSFCCAAGISLVGTAAYQAVHECGKIGPGSRVLILGGSTAVGVLAIQMSKRSGAFVAVTCHSHSVSYVSQFEPDVVVPYDKEKWYSHPQCERFDLVLDIAGAANTLEILKTTDNLIAIGAAFVSLVNPSIGVSAQSHPPFSYCRFYCVRQNTLHQEAIATQVSEESLRLPIAGTHAFTEEGVREMFQCVKSGRSHGKHVLQIF